MNYNAMNKSELIALLKEKDNLILKLENKKELRKELLEEAREKKEQQQEKRIEKLKRKIKEIIAEKKEKISIREICKVLEINRQTVYNNNLNKFIEKVYKDNFLKSGSFNFLEMRIKNARGKYNISISQSNFVFAQIDKYEFSEKSEMLNFIREFKEKNEYRIIVEINI